jgi:hypothetical protein
MARPSTRPSAPTRDEPAAEERARAKRAKRAPRPHLRALEGEERLSADFGSLAGDLSLGAGPREPEWRVHDRTHLEFAVDYRARPAAATAEASGPAERELEYEWDCYFFVPESLRLHDQTYEKHEIYDDLQSYVRLAVPAVPFETLADGPIADVERALAAQDPDVAVRELRFFACLVRASSGDARRRVLALHRARATEPAAATTQGGGGGDGGDAGGGGARPMTPAPRGAGASDALGDACRLLAREARRIGAAVRHAVDRIPADREELREAARWVEEDVSRALEALLASLAIDLREGGAPEASTTALAAAAVDEAAARAARGLDGVGRADADAAAIEHLEFRRHVLKRFTSSVLWLRLEVRRGAGWVLQLLYAIAASAAMGFALVAAVLQDPGSLRFGSGNFWLGAGLVVLAYAVKDRIKALLQSAFSRVVERHFPDRRWRILDEEREFELGEVEERAAFLAMDEVPADVLATRRDGRRFRFEEQARPERVLWHHKSVTVHADDLAAADPRVGGLTEIFRLNLRRWLDHTDDPSRRIVFADPADRQVYSAVAPRVYNIGVVYRLRRAGEADAAWHRARVVVTRKGIRRIDRIK